MIAGRSCSWVVPRVNWEAGAPNLSCLSPDYTFCTIEYPRVRVKTKVLSSLCQCICCVWTYLGLQLFCLCLLLLFAVCRQVVGWIFFLRFQTNWKKDNNPQIILLTPLFRQCLEIRHLWSQKGKWNHPWVSDNSKTVRQIGVLSDLKCGRSNNASISATS